MNTTGLIYSRPYVCLYIVKFIMSYCFVYFNRLQGFHMRFPSGAGLGKMGQ